MNVERSNVVGKQQMVRLEGRKRGWDPKMPRVAREMGLEIRLEKQQLSRAPGQAGGQALINPDSIDLATLEGLRG